MYDSFDASRYAQACDCISEFDDKVAEMRQQYIEANASYEARIASMQNETTARQDELMQREAGKRGSDYQAAIEMRQAELERQEQYLHQQQQESARRVQSREVETASRQQKCMAGDEEERNRMYREAVKAFNVNGSGANGSDRGPAMYKAYAKDAQAHGRAVHVSHGKGNPSNNKAGEPSSSTLSVGTAAALNRQESFLANDDAQRGEVFRQEIELYHERLRLAQEWEIADKEAARREAELRDAETRARQDRLVHC